jgi:branched-chain amino acid transport system permease protein
LVILTGWAGQISLGQFAIAGVASATAAGLAANHGVDFFITIIVAALVGALVAIAVGLPALRIQGLFLAVTTLAFAFTVASIFNRTYFGWLVPKSGHLVNRPVLWNAFDLSDSSQLGPFTIKADAKFYYVCVVFLVIALMMARSLRRNRSGRIFIAVRDNGRTAQAFGANLARTRLAAFAVSGLIAGMAGGLLAYLTPAFADNAFPPERSIEMFTLAVIGGIGSLPGAILGAVFAEGLPLLPGLRDIDQIRLLTTGLGLLFVLLFLPGGLAEGMYRIRDRWLRAVALRRHIHVPSLIADSRVEEQEQEAEAHAIVAAATTTEIAEAVDAGELEHVIVCPKCSALVPVSEVETHEHFTVLRVASTGDDDDDDGDTGKSADELRLERLSR